MTRGHTNKTTAEITPAKNQLRLAQPSGPQNLIGPRHPSDMFFSFSFSQACLLKTNVLYKVQQTLKKLYSLYNLLQLSPYQYCTEKKYIRNQLEREKAVAMGGSWRRSGSLIVLAIIFFGKCHCFAYRSDYFASSIFYFF